MKTQFFQALKLFNIFSFKYILIILITTILIASFSVSFYLSSNRFATLVDEFYGESFAELQGIFSDAIRESIVLGEYANARLVCKKLFLNSSIFKIEIKDEENNINIP